MVGKKKSYKDFGVAMDELKNKAEVSYETLGIGSEISPSYLWKLARLRNPNPPKYEIIEKIAKFFHVEPEYFYDYRLKKFLDYLNKHRKFLNNCENLMSKHKLSKKEVPEPEEELEEELEEKKEEAL